MIAFVLCLSACSERKDAETTPSQSDSERSASQVQDTTSDDDPARKYFGDASGNSSGTVSGEGSGSSEKTDREQNSQISDESIAASEGGGKSEKPQPQKNDKQNNNANGSKSDPGNAKSAEPTETQPTVAARSSEKDNAEVNINDL